MDPLDVSKVELAYMLATKNAANPSDLAQKANLALKINSLHPEVITALKRLQEVATAVEPAFKSDKMAAALIDRLSKAREELPAVFEMAKKGDTSKLFALIGPFVRAVDSPAVKTLHDVLERQAAVITAGRRNRSSEYVDLILDAKTIREARFRLADCDCGGSYEDVMGITPPPIDNTYDFPREDFQAMFSFGLGWSAKDSDIQGLLYLIALPDAHEFSGIAELALSVAGGDAVASTLLPDLSSIGKKLHADTLADPQGAAMLASLQSRRREYLSLGARAARGDRQALTSLVNLAAGIEFTEFMRKARHAGADYVQALYLLGGPGRQSSPVVGIMWQKSLARARHSLQRFNTRPARIQWAREHCTFEKHGRYTLVTDKKTGEPCDVGE